MPADDSNLIEGEIFLKKIEGKGDAWLRLYRGEFRHFDKTELLKELENGLISSARRALGDELLRKEILKEAGIDINAASITEIARFHQEGMQVSRWSHGKTETYTLTPFVSLTSSEKMAIIAAATKLEMRKGMEMGVYLDEDGLPNYRFYLEINEFVERGHRPLVYVMEFPKSSVVALKSVAKIEELTYRVAKNDENRYGEQEYIAYAVPCQNILGVAVFTGNPYLRKEENKWIFIKNEAFCK